jgi:hypothetical protein
VIASPYIISNDVNALAALYVDGTLESTDAAYRFR